MPGATAELGEAEAAFETVKNEIEKNGNRFEKAGASDVDVAFLKELLDNNVINSLVKVQDSLEYEQPIPAHHDTIALVKGVNEELTEGTSRDAEELQAILSKPHVRALVVAHDDVANKNYEEPDVYYSDEESASNYDAGEISGDSAIRVVGIRKTDDEPLGITVVREENDLVIARILAGSIIDKQGLLHVGDVIKEVNGVVVESPEQLAHIMRNTLGSVTFKVLPSYLENAPVHQVYMKALFSWNPAKDNLIPTKDAGLQFRFGDILQVLSTDDDNWWQAKKLDEEATGLVPSTSLEEKRKAFVRPDHDYTHKSWLCGLTFTTKKKKVLYQSSQASELDTADIPIYEEIVRMPPFPRKCLILVGAQGVGRRTLKNRLMNTDPNRFGSTIPHTSRPPRDGEENGRNYYFVTREAMELDIQQGKYLEHGDYGGNLYGTKLESIRTVLRQGKMCILDIAPNAVKLIRTQEFMPFVVFIAAPSVAVLRNMLEKSKMERMGRDMTFDRARNRGAPSVTTLDFHSEADFKRTVDESIRIERSYRHLFDHFIINDNMDKAYEELLEAIDDLTSKPQWVPVSWVYN